MSNSNAGRGVLRLIYLHQCVKLLDVVAITIAVAVLLRPEHKMPPMLCLYFEVGKHKQGCSQLYFSQFGSDFLNAFDQKIWLTFTRQALVGFIRIDYYMAGFTIALGR